MIDPVITHAIAIGGGLAIFEPLRRLAPKALRAAWKWATKSRDDDARIQAADIRAKAEVKIAETAAQAEIEVARLEAHATEAAAGLTGKHLIVAAETAHVAAETAQTETLLSALGRIEHRLIDCQEERDQFRGYVDAAELTLKNAREENARTNEAMRAEIAACEKARQESESRAATLVRENAELRRGA